MHLPLSELILIAVKGAAEQQESGGSVDKTIIDLFFYFTYRILVFTLPWILALLRRESSRVFGGSELAMS